MLTPILYRRIDLQKALGVSRQTLDNLRKKPDFPKPVMLSNRTPAWKYDDIMQWINQLKQ